MDFRFLESKNTPIAGNYPAELELGSNEVRSVGRLCFDALLRMYRSGKPNREQLVRPVSYVRDFNIRPDEQTRVFTHDTEYFTELASYLITHAFSELPPNEKKIAQAKPHPAHPDTAAFRVAKTINKRLGIDDTPDDNGGGSATTTPLFEEQAVPYDIDEVLEQLLSGQEAVPYDFDDALKKLLSEEGKQDPNNE